MRYRRGHKHALNVMQTMLAVEPWKAASLAVRWESEEISRQFREYGFRLPEATGAVSLNAPGKG
jgi:hypothetical protein